MVTEIFETVGEVVGSYTDVITDLFEALVGIFYNAETSSMTLFGTLFLIALGIGVVVWAFNLVRSMVRL